MGMYISKLVHGRACGRFSERTSLRLSWARVRDLQLATTSLGSYHEAGIRSAFCAANKHSNAFVA